MSYKELIYKNFYSKRIGRQKPISIEKLGKNLPTYKNYIDRFFPKNKEIKICDLGCGFGAFLNLMHNNGYKNIEGVDCSSEMINIANDLGINCIVKSDVITYLKSKEDSSIDLICAIDFFEHFGKEDLFVLVSEIFRVLKPNGFVITHQPNGEGVFGAGILYGDFTHEIAFTRVSISQIFLSNKFSRIKSYEDKPLVYSLSSFFRRILWDFFVRPLYIFLISVESGGCDKDIILTKNFTTIARK